MSQVTENTNTTGPVAIVWQVANENPKAKRSDVIAMCVMLGVNYYTARTQYQRWLHRNS